MAKMNIAKLMVPKVLIKFLHESDTIRQGLEVMTQSHYTALPVLDDQDRFVGCVSEGDFLRHILATGTTDKRYHEQFLVGSILRKDYCPAIDIEADAETVIGALLSQNFVPVVDDREALCGLLTRRTLIDELAKRAMETNT